MLPVTPSIIPEPFAEHGAKNVIPEESPGASEPNASWTQGFPPVTMLNRQAGGKPPLGQDFNGILNALSQHLFFTQSGCVYPWMGADETTGFPGLNYLGGSHVLGSDLKEYIAVHPSGPDVPQTGGGYVGPKDPVTDTQHLYWRPEVTSADIPEFDGVTIREINGTYGVPEFTPPTASAPGKAGIVPGPKATPNVNRLLHYLSVEGWRKLSTSMFSPDLSGSDSQELGLAGVATDSFDANTIITGYYHSNNWTNAPGSSGLLISVPVRGNKVANYSIVQIFFSYVGPSSYRTLKVGGIPRGTVPAPDDWEVWQSINAPRPHAAAGIGQWVQLWTGTSGGNTIILPPGGVWAYSLTGLDAGQTVRSHGDGVLGGGTAITLRNGNGVVITDVVGFGWRVA